MKLDCVLEELRRLRAQAGNVEVKVWDGFEHRPLQSISLLELEAEESAGASCQVDLDAEEMPSRKRAREGKRRRREATARDLLDAQGMIMSDEMGRLTPDD